MAKQRWRRWPLPLLVLALLVLCLSASADQMRDAALNGDLATIRRLVKADTQAVNRRVRPGEADSWEVGATPLHAAARNDHLEVVKFLLAHGADVNAVRKDGETAFAEATYHGFLDIARSLLKAGSKINTSGWYGNTPLHWAADHGSSETVNVLIDLGADINMRREDGGTPLHAAAYTNNTAAIRALLARGAKLEERNKAGETPLHLAAAQGHPEAVALLMDRGANTSAKNNDGKTPLDLALNRGNMPVLERLLANMRVTLQLDNVTVADAMKQLLESAKASCAVESPLKENVSLHLTDAPFPAALKSIAQSAGGPFAYEYKNNVLHVALAPQANHTEVAADAVVTSDPHYRFLKNISQSVLNNYLSRAVTHYGLCSTSPEPATAYFDDDMRMLTGLGVKFIGRAAYAWVPPDDDEAHYRQAAERAQRVHQIDPEIVLQAAVFEAVYEGVEKIPVPDWVFTEFGLPVDKRNFYYAAMLYDQGELHNHWTQGASVPDMSKLETRMYFYYRARRYIDAGFEAIHFGQVELMDHRDPDHRYWLDMLTRVRRYAAAHARRRMVLCDAHTHGCYADGRLLFDFHSWPLMAREIVGSPQRAELVVGYYNSIYGLSKGGVTPSGWECSALPYLCEIDCGGNSNRGGQPIGFPWIWGYDCGSWFAHQNLQYRNAYLKYAYNWLRENDPAAHLQMPTRLNLAVPVEGVKMWHGNMRSKACPDGFNQEEAIKAIWESEARSRH
jgi:ankyrin repeat protein